MGDNDDLVDVLVVDIEDYPDNPPAGLSTGDIDVRRKLEDKLEEVRLRKLTQDYDF
jgi:hypothetical protein